MAWHAARPTHGMASTRGGCRVQGDMAVCGEDLGRGNEGAEAWDEWAEWMRTQRERAMVTVLLGGGRRMDREGVDRWGPHASERERER